MIAFGNEAVSSQKEGFICLKMYIQGHNREPCMQASNVSFRKKSIRSDQEDWVPGLLLVIRAVARTVDIHVIVLFGNYKQETNLDFES